MSNFSNRYITMLFFIFLMGTSLLTAQQIDWDIKCAGARAAGLGGAFIGVADDATAITWNPAGLTQLKKTETSIVGKYGIKEIDYENSSDNITNTSIQKHQVINFLSVASPLGSNKVVAALAWQQEIDGYYKQDRQESRGGVETITFGGARDFGDMLSLGIAGNVWTGKIKIKDSSIDNPMESTDEFSGVNFIFGVMVDFSMPTYPNPLKVGLTVRTPFDLKDKYKGTDGSRENKMEMPWMFGLGASYRFSETFIMALDFESRLYSQSSFLIPEFEDDITISQHDLKQVRIGTEYLILKSHYKIPLRFGLQTVPTILSNLGTSGQEKAQVIGSGAAIGTGFMTKLFSFDVTVTAQTYQQKRNDNEKTAYINAALYISGILYF